jgi:hypothetical protein
MPAFLRSSFQFAITRPRRVFHRRVMTAPPAITFAKALRDLLSAGLHKPQANAHAINGLH